MIKHPHPSWFLTILIFGMILACSSRDDHASPVKRTQFLMGTLAEITVPGPDSKETQTAIDLAFAEIKRIENLMSVYLDDSEISRLNKKAGGDFINVSHEVIKVIREGVRWGEASHGDFDVSIGPLVKLWDFDGGGNKVPDSQSLAKAVALVNYKDILIEDGKVRLRRSGMALDMGGIAKGYAVDRAAGILKKNGIRAAIVNAGGDLIAYGTRDTDVPWVIGLQHPRKPEEIIASFAARSSSAGTAAATSGDYQKFFMRGGVRYHHLLIPQTGMPKRGTLSATVTAPTVMQADALATAAFIMGPVKGKALLETLDGVEGMWIMENEEKIFTKGFRSQPEFKLR